MKIDTLVLSNQERYSSMVKSFSIVGSKSYPVMEWISLGEFVMENRLGEQEFKLVDHFYPRYIKIMCGLIPPGPLSVSQCSVRMWSSARVCV